MQIKMVHSESDIPDWADDDAKAELAEVFGDGGDDERSALAVHFDGEATEVYWDGGEAEDNTFRRDWRWVDGLVRRAFDAGRQDYAALSEDHQRLRDAVGRIPV